MALGAYSVVRYADNLRDERVNLGVIVWHPTDGFHWRVLAEKALDRVRSVNPMLRGSDIQRQIKTAEERLADSEGKDGLLALSHWLREGLQVSEPFPARLYSATETADRLFGMLVRQAEPPKEAMTHQTPFGERVVHTLYSEAKKFDPAASVEDLGSRPILGVNVTVGVRTEVLGSVKLWRTLALGPNFSTQVQRAKAAASDLRKVKLISEFANIQQIVALRATEKTQGMGLDESEKWLEGEGARVLRIPRLKDIASKLDEVLAPAA